MPTATDKLSPSSSPGQIAAAISESIKKLMDEGMPQEQATAASYEMARQATGKSLGGK